MGCRSDELEEKAVVNTCDGKCLGHITAYEIDPCEGRIIALFVTDRAQKFGFGKRCSEVCVPWDKIVKIGADIILVEAPSAPPPPAPPPPSGCECCSHPRKKHWWM